MAIHYESYFPRANSVPYIKSTSLQSRIRFSDKIRDHSWVLALVWNALSAVDSGIISRIKKHQLTLEQY